jgi:hypothetical protein
VIHKDALKNYDKAVIPLEKIRGYSLREPNKARVFKSALGYTVNDAAELISNILANIGQYPAVDKGSNEYGARFRVDINLNGKNGRTAVVRTAWLYDNGSDIPRLVSAYIKTEKPYGGNYYDAETV